MLKDLPYARQWIEEEDIRAVMDILRSPWLTQGPAVERFEGALADWCGVKCAVAVSSGTAALHLACIALGLGPGQRLVTSALSFVGSANCALYCGASPDLTDVDPATGNMTADTLEVALQDQAPTVVIPVHFGGRPVDMEAITRVARGAAIIEDACHAIGAEYLGARGWSRVGACEHSAATVFSFHPVKPMTTGEGGAILTQDETLAERLRSLRSHGIVRDAVKQAEVGGWFYEMIRLGYNYRMTDMQAALGIIQLRRLGEGISRRRRLAMLYGQQLNGLESVVLPPPEDNVRSAWHLYPIRIRSRTASRRTVYEHLRKQGILVQVHYIPIHLQPYYQERLGFRPGRFPRAEAFYEEELSLPLFATMTDEDVFRVSEAVREILA